VGLLHILPGHAVEGSVRAIGQQVQGVSVDPAGRNH
jgi:hypothetical protein